MEMLSYCQIGWITNRRKIPRYRYRYLADKAELVNNLSRQCSQNFRLQKDYGSQEENL